MSGYSDAAVTEHGMLREGSAFIHEPVRVDELAAKVHQVLDAQEPAGSVTV